MEAQEYMPQLEDPSIWQMTHPSKTSIDGNVVIIDASDEDKGALMALKDIKFNEGVIEVDIKGANTPGRSFVGLAFNLQSETTYEAIYFRPFNFHNPEKKSHSVQYINMPSNTWRMLRNNYPGKYEDEIQNPPNGDEWFHASIVLTKEVVMVYVNESTKPSLTIDRISLFKKGGIGLWVGSNTKGAFKNLKFTKDKSSR